MTTQPRPEPRRRSSSGPAPDPPESPLVPADEAPDPAPPTAGRKPARYRTIAAAIAERIKVEDLPPGSLLPSETDLAETFGVTRMTVRQALAGLAGAGLIERRHGRGTIVAPIKLQRQSLLPIGLAEELK
ncbi:MAG TPA: GntR family transcriptional regulator, partial [Candidatus Bathyarchaeia archaeon]|nr:GntR family transcriptional regulator [Candidatus Bathyarchaeia archaeon]